MFCIRFADEKNLDGETAYAGEVHAGRLRYAFQFEGRIT